jgi:hypothetical protein
VREGVAALALAAVLVAGEGGGRVEADEAVGLEEALRPVEGGNGGVLGTGLRWHRCVRGWCEV